ncbi:MAG: ribulose-phosphate 3-epimerase [Thermoplasmata archaeon]
MIKIKISPSMLSADFSCLKESIEKVKEADMLHLDVMDGHFVPNITFGPCVIKDIRPMTDMIFDAHLMIAEPEKYIQDFVDSGSDIITIHKESFESHTKIKNTLKDIRKLGLKSGISINPDTSFKEIENFLEYTDLLLIMTVNPGFGGQSFMKEVVPKIQLASEYIKDHGYDTELSVDGGISPETAPLVVKAGADILVAGSAIFRGNPTENLKMLRKTANGIV